ncbi:MAG: PorT family protein [Cyclobacteriaceae bacterium]|nr:PorT family protein [Cyclobacteriaceae bacterium]
MKKLLALIPLIYFLYTVPANAQVGLQVGAVASPDYAFVPYDSLGKVSGAIGFTVGVFYKYWLTDHVSIQPALNFLNKRWWEELDDGGTFYITRVSMNYIELPVQAVFTAKKTKGFFVGGGPSLMLGLSGERTVTEEGNVIEEDELKPGTESAPEKKMTVAVNVMAGYAFKRILVGLNYSKGITNQPANDDANHGNVSNVNLRISVLFGKQ